MGDGRDVDVSLAKKVVMTIHVGERGNAKGGDDTLMTTVCFDGPSHTFLQAVQGYCVTAKYAQTEGPQA